MQSVFLPNHCEIIVYDAKIKHSPEDRIKKYVGPPFLARLVCILSTIRENRKSHSTVYIIFEFGVADGIRYCADVTVTIILILAFRVMGGVQNCAVIYYHYYFAVGIISGVWHCSVT